MKTVKMLVVEMPDQSKWGVPVEVIARNRAEYYAEEFGGDVEKSLAEDTLPLFEDDSYEIEDWAANNMNWKDVAEHARLLELPSLSDYQEGWINGEKEVRDVSLPDQEEAG